MGEPNRSTSGDHEQDRPGPPLDALDARLIGLLAAEPRIGVLECSRRLGVARGTVQARLDKLIARGVIRGFGPDISPAAIGFNVTSFVSLEISQRYGHERVAGYLAQIPEVLEAYTITGSHDLLCRVVARSNADLQRVIDQIVAYEGIVRASSIIALAEQIPYRVLPLVRSASASPKAARPQKGHDTAPR
ncbi:MAG TPA: Lrp/AsnC family transcriptional regulator [Micromonosporaceae bacterium]